eukprot:6977187-Prymnesium_polylepis.1
MGDGLVDIAGGHARRQRMKRARWSGGPLGAAQITAPFGSLLAEKRSFFSYDPFRPRFTSWTQGSQAVTPL